MSRNNSSRSSSRTNNQETTPTKSIDPSVTPVNITTNKTSTKHKSVSPKRHAAKSRTRSKSPVKIRPSYKPSPHQLSPDRLYQREWKQIRRKLEKKQEEERVNKENEFKFHRLNKISQEPSAYPSLFPQQEKLRERRALDYQQRVLKGLIPVIRENLFVAQRLANVRGEYDVKKMEQDYAKHKSLLMKNKTIKPKK